MTKVYCYSRCSTCKKALAWLDAHGYKYDLIDIKTQNPDEKTLRSLHKKSGLPLKKFFNTSGILYREMELSKKLPSMTEDQQFALLASDGEAASFNHRQSGNSRLQRRPLAGSAEVELRQARLHCFKIVFANQVTA